MDNEFVVRDIGKLRDSETVVRTADHLMKLLTDGSRQLDGQQGSLAESFEALADLVQVAVLKHTGVEVREVGADSVDLETAELALNSLQSNLGVERVERRVEQSDAELALRNRQQAIVNLLHVYQLHRSRGNEEQAAQVLEETLALVHEVAGVLGQVDVNAQILSSSRSVVLVEHDQQERSSMQQLLSEYGSDVQAFGDDEQALRFVFEQPRQGLMLLNVRDADTGRQTISRLRECENGRSLRLIGMSPLAACDVLASRDLGMEWLQKPFHILDMVRALNLVAASAAA